MLSVGPFVRVFALDFTKAFDMVRHSTLLEKMASLNLPDEVYNWILHFFTGRSHATRFAGVVSPSADILASVIQGSSIGPASYIVNAADLRQLHAGNEIIKFADDTYMHLLIPATNSSTSEFELTHIRSWASKNNLKLNNSKSCTVHQRGPVCVRLLIVPDSTRFFEGASATITVQVTFRPSKICFLTLITHYLNVLLITVCMFYTIFYLTNQHNHTICVKDVTATLFLKRILNLMNVTI